MTAGKAVLRLEYPGDVPQTSFLVVSRRANRFGSSHSLHGVNWFAVLSFGAAKLCFVCGSNTILYTDCILAWMFLAAGTTWNDLMFDMFATRKG